MVGAYDWPPAFAATTRSFVGLGRGQAAEERVAAAFAAVAPSGPAPDQPPWRHLVSQLPPLRWLELAECATQTRRALLGSKLTLALQLQHQAGASAVVLHVGGDGAGDVGLAVGVPDDPQLSRAWVEATATELIFEPGRRRGAEVLHEGALLCSATLSAAEDDHAREELPTIAELLLRSGGSLPPWSVDVMLRPLPVATAELLRAESAGLALQAARSVNRTEATSDSDSSTFADARMDHVHLVATQWQGLAEEALRVGAWTVAVRLQASTPEDLRLVTSLVSGALSDEQYTSSPRRRQLWQRAAVRPGAPELASWLTSRDAADLLSPPASSVGRVQARRPLEAGRRQSAGRQPIVLGTWLGSEVCATVDLADLGAHAFIAGITGSGKSTTTRALLAQVSNLYDVPFLVIDPAKTDYADFGRHLRGGLRLVQGRDLRLNVLRPWPGCDPAQHVTRVGNAFRGSFSLPSPVPYVVSILFEELAQLALTADVTLHHAWSRLDALVAELQYRGEIEDNIRASLGLRLRLLLQPTRADRVACPGASPEWLTAGPTVVQLGDLADDEERNFLASMLVLYVADAARASGLSTGVRHLTVVEEAHRLMPEPRVTGSEEGDAGSVSARLMSQLLAEVRAYGESLVVIDQSPAAVAREVLRNTNVKLVHRLVDVADQRVLGGALGLDETDSPMVGSLAVGRLLVSSRDLVRPQTVQVAGVDDQVRPPSSPPPPLPAPRQPCHHPARSAAHHLAERWGRDMEAQVGLWVLGVRADLQARARQVAAAHPGTAASCLVSVGVRRWVGTLQALGRLGDGEVDAKVDELWNAALTGRRPSLPDRPEVLPYEGCVVCPEPCVARGTVSARVLAAHRRAERLVLRADGTAAVVAAIGAAAADVGVELGAARSTPTVMTCVAVHLAEQAGVSRAWLASVQDG